MGLPLSAGALVLLTFGERPLRTSWLIVGTYVISVYLGFASPAFVRGQALSVVFAAAVNDPRHAKVWHSPRKNPADRKQAPPPPRLSAGNGLHPLPHKTIE